MEIINSANSIYINSSNAVLHKQLEKTANNQSLTQIAMELVRERNYYSSSAFYSAIQIIQEN